MATTPTGTIFAIASAFAAAKTVTAISNASEGVVSCTAHGYTNGDLVQVYTGWGRLNRRIAKVKAATTDAFTLDSLNTTNTEFFPIGSSAGTVRKITTWQQISKILNPTSSGGEPKNIAVKYVDQEVEESLNDGFTATTEQFEMDADEYGGAGYSALQALTEVQTDTVLKKTLRTGTVILTPCRLAINENVKLTDGQIMTNMVSVNGNGRVTRYAA